MIIDYNGLMTMALLVGVAAMAVIISIMLDLADGLYFLYNGEKYYATAISDSVNALLSKNGSPINLNMGTLSTAISVKQNGNYYVNFVTD
jgi:hypothetical protein